jgi:hypothetical protein
LQQSVIKDGVTGQWCETGKTLSSAVDLSQVREMLIYAGNGGSAPIYIDDIRAE